MMNASLRPRGKRDRRPAWLLRKAVLAFLFFVTVSGGPAAPRAGVRLMLDDVAENDRAMLGDVFAYAGVPQMLEPEPGDLPRLLLALSIVDFQVELGWQNLRGLDRPGYRRRTFDWSRARADARPDLAAAELRRILQGAESVDPAPGPLRSTGRSLDIALRGNGLLRVILPDGNFAYERQGRLFLNRKREVVNRNGHLLDPYIVLPVDAASHTLRIDKNGTVSVHRRDEIEPTSIGVIDTFLSPDRVHRSGERMLQGFVEESNVRFDRETVRITALLNLRDALRAAAGKLDDRPVFSAGLPAPEIFQAWTAYLTRAMEVHAENAAHERTPGYKALSIQATENGARITRDFRMGSLKATGNHFDLALTAENGFFKIRLPGGGSAYTRDGRLKIDSKQQLVDARGRPLEPPIILPSGGRLASFTISKSGEVSIKAGDTPEQVRVGRIDVYDFPNPEGLKNLVTHPAYFLETPESGPAIPVSPACDGAPGILQKFLETSNVRPEALRTEMRTTARRIEFACALGGTHC